MAGFFPTTRTLAANYGQDLENERPIRNPALEFDAGDLNNLRHDVAALTQVAPRAMLMVTCSAGAAAKTRAYGIAIAHFTVTYAALGKVTIDIAPAAGIAVSDATISVYRPIGSTAAFGSVDVQSTLQVKTHTSAVAGDLDASFVVSFF